MVNHPEFIPTARTVRLSGAGFSNIISDFYWLSAIQYIGSNVIWSSYKSYLYEMLNLITDLNPYFTYPYEVWELLLPSYNYRYENLSDSQIKKNVKQAENLALKWINNTCDLKKVDSIKNEYDLKKLWTDEKYIDPCIDPMIPYYLWYIYYWNEFDSKKSSDYYKVTVANNDAPKWARTIAAIMEWKTWNREKSIVMFLSLASASSGNKDNKTDLCTVFSKQLWDVMFGAFQNKKTFDWKFLSQIELYRKDIIKKLWEEKVDSTNISSENYCSNYLNKAVREMNLAYLEQADKQFFLKEKRHALSSNELFNKWYIDYLPSDFQKQNDWSEIIYYYNNDTSNWDFKMWRNK